MRNKILVFSLIFLVFCGIFSNNQPIVKNNIENFNPLTQDLIVDTPEPHRESQYSKWTQCSVLINTGENMGSGTICYFDGNYAYIISCGHLWNIGTPHATIKAYYHNYDKLETPEKYTAEVLMVNHNYDVSLLKFKPNWKPKIYCPISAFRQIKEKERFHSLGSDKGSEPADYIVEYVEHKEVRYFEGNFLITKYNSPRRGRSGGGLIDKDGYVIGICSQTSDFNGLGLGIYVSTESIIKALKEEKMDGLLNISSPLQRRNIFKF